MFTFERHSGRQRAARQALAPALIAAIPAYLLLDTAGTRLLGGVWGAVVAVVTIGTPLGTLWWVGETGGGTRQAWRRGAGLATISGLLYLTVFSSGW